VKIVSTFEEWQETPFAKEIKSRFGFDTGEAIMETKASGQRIVHWLEDSNGNKIMRLAFDSYFDGVMVRIYEGGFTYKYMVVAGKAD
jgi:hypothetical protein